MKKILLLLIATSTFSTMRSSAQAKALLNHVAIYVVNLKASTNFYKNVIGLDTIPEPFHDGKHTWFSIGPKSHLHVIEGAAMATPHEKNNHLCFTVLSVEAFASLLDKSNIEYENVAGAKRSITTRADGVKQIYFQDPDGYWIEINDARE